MRTAPSVTTIAGQVGGDGTVLSGAGFTVTREAVGQYSIRFLGMQVIGFAPMSIGVATFGIAAGGLNVVNGVVNSVRFYNTSLALVDSAFTFVATVKPRL